MWYTPTGQPTSFAPGDINSDGEVDDRDGEAFETLYALGQGLYDDGDRRGVFRRGPDDQVVRCVHARNGPGGRGESLAPYR